MKNNNKEIVTKNGKDQQLIAQSKVKLGFEDMSKEDLQLPRVKLLQSMSRELQDEALDLKPGQIINSLTKEVFKTLEFIPIVFSKMWIKWRDMQAGGGIEWISSDQNDERVIEGTIWHDGIRPEVTTYLTFLVVMNADFSKPMTLAFANMSFPTGRKLLSLARFANDHLFAHSYTLSSRKEKNDKGTFFIYDVFQGKKNDEKTRALAEKLYYSYFEIRHAVAKESAKLQEEEGNSQAEATDSEKLENDIPF